MDTFLPLGSSSAIKADAVSQCNAFRLHVTNHCGRIQGAYLHMEHLENGRCSMSVVFDPEILEEAMWANEVRGYAEVAWEMVIHGKQPEVKILARSRGV